MPACSALLGGQFYHRAAEKRQLEAALYSSAPDPELVLVSGGPGTGKTALVRSLDVPFFVEVKYDALHPYDDFQRVLHAVNVLVDEIACLDSVRARVESSLDDEADCLLFGALPSLSVCFEAVPRTRDRGTDSQKRLFLSLCKMLSAIATVAEPLVLFLDDVQWAGSTTIGFLSFLASESRIPGFLVIAACRSNEITVDHKFAILLRELEACEVGIVDVRVGNFTQEEVELVVADVLPELSVGGVRALSETIHSKTGGTIFFVLVLLRELIQKEGRSIDSAEWAFQAGIEAVETYGSSGTIDRWLANKLYAMPSAMRDTLETASCLGAQFRTTDLAAITEVSPEEHLVALGSAGLIDRSQPGMWRFQHDCIQQRSYALVPEQDREQRHLNIGRVLWNAYTEGAEEVDLATVIVQLRLGARLLTDQAERDRVASLLLHAGEKASSSSSFAAAVSYLDLAIELLGPRHWKDEYFLSLNVFNAAAEMEYCIGNFDRALQLIAEVVANARNEDDKSRALTLQIYTLGSDHKPKQAVDLSLDVLSSMGVRLPRRLLLPRMIASLVSTKTKLEALSNDDILRLPETSDRSAISVMNVLALMQFHTSLSRPLLTPMVLSRIVDLTLEHGLSPTSAIGFAGLSAVMSVLAREVDLSRRLAELSIAILDRFDCSQWRARVVVYTHAYALTFDQPLRLLLKPVLSAHRMALGNGDIEFAIISAAIYSGMALYSAADLGQLRSDMQVFLKLADLHSQKSAKTLLLSLMQSVVNLMDSPTSPSTLDGVYMTESSYEETVAATKNRVMRDLYLSNKLQLCSYFHDYEGGCQAMVRTERTRRKSYTPNGHIRHYFHAGLCCAMVPKYRKRARQHLGKLRKMADLCEKYARHKVLLLEAVLDAVDGRPATFAKSKFDESIELARAESLWNEEGLACEHAAKAAVQMGDLELARSYATHSLEAYRKWGATTKCALLRKELDRG